MGGHGSGSSTASAKNRMFGTAKPLKVETVYMERSGYQRRGYYKDTVLEAVDNGNGEARLVYATADSYSKTAKTNKTNYVTYTLNQGFVNSSAHNLNFENINAFSGQTYSVKDELKRRGYKYRNGKWVKA